MAAHGARTVLACGCGDCGGQPGCQWWRWGADEVLELVRACDSAAAAAGVRGGFARLAELWRAAGEPPPHPPEAHIALARLAERFVARLSGQVWWHIAALAAGFLLRCRSCRAGRVAPANRHVPGADR